MESYPYNVSLKVGSLSGQARRRALPRSSGDFSRTVQEAGARTVKAKRTQCEASMHRLRQLDQ